MRPPIRDLWLPAALCLAQLAVWPGWPWLTGKPVTITEAAVLILAVAAACTALAFRRVAPLAVLATMPPLTLVANLAAPQPEVLAVISAADSIALFSVTVHRPVRISGPATLGIFLTQTTIQCVLQDIGLQMVVVSILFSICCYALVWGLGRVRRRWRAQREAVAAQLGRAEADHHYAVAEERRRLARELHDISAHHLSTIVVHAQAAERVPALAPQALSFAASTGLETLGSLRRLVEVMDVGEDDGPATLGAVRELAQGFARLGQLVTVEVGGERQVPGEVAAAGHRIVQEALTNALRYAEGAQVLVRLEYRPEAVEITVDNGRGTASGAGLGGGRGLAGMRERVMAVGGEFAAGAQPGGGWRVRAVLPCPAGDPPPPPPVGPWRRIRDDRIVDIALASFAALWPALMIVGSQQDPQAPDVVYSWTQGVLLTLVVLLRALPMLWRRRYPWLAACAVTGAALLWLGLMALGLITPGSFWLFTMAALPEAFAVYALAAYARPVWLTWLGAVLCALGLSAGTIFGAYLFQPWPEKDLLPAVVALEGAVFYFVPLLIIWIIGAIAGHRRRRLVSREAVSLAAAAESVLLAAQEERARIAYGLQGSVLAHTSAVVERATSGEPAALSEVATEARAALTSMRELLGVLRQPGASGASSGPAPTAAAIPALCSASGVTFATQGEPRRLPAEVDVSAYRLVEAALAAGPAEAQLIYGRSHLRIRLLGTTNGTLAHEDLAARVDATGGKLTIKDSELDAWYPV
ncbi:sensor histidine kinase [Longispora albida]|uniref:sensor histidine kinase n=1 Tax=Longispora albida TaxID=203523 RepID=UPI00038192AE|nr:histidine kinase [Longispora albida]